MNRFFSKLNLNDIKIKPDGNSFPPDADETLEDAPEVVAETAPEAEAEVVETRKVPDFFAPKASRQAAVAPKPVEVAETPAVDVAETHVDEVVEAPAHNVAEFQTNNVAEPQTNYVADRYQPSIEEADKASFETEEIEDIDDAPVQSNGHSSSEISYEESTALYATAHVQTEERVTEIVSDGVVIGLGEVLKVSARSRPSAVAGAIAGVVREVGRAEVQAIGAGATNQAIKAVAIARDYLSESGIEAVCVPAFIDVTIENEDRTAIRLVVEPR